MRLSFNMKFNQSLNGILNTQNKLTRAETQLSKQTRILSPADDPAASAKVIGLDQTLAQTEQYQSNSVLLKNSLSLEETVLTSMRTTMDRVNVLAIAAGNGIYTDEEKKALAEELRIIQVELYDLMNTRNAEGGYIFSGYQDQTPAYGYNQSTGEYEYQGDDGQKALQISPTITLAGNDSGKMIFDDVATRFKTTPAVISSGSATSASVVVHNQSTFDTFFRQNYDGLTAANNNYSVSLTAPSNYEILNNGSPLTPAVSGTFTPGEAIQFNGLEISIEDAVMPLQIDFSLQPPEKKNLLNTVGDFITALQSTALSSTEFVDILNDTLNQLGSSMTKVDSTLSSIGGRMNVLDSVYGTNEDLTITNKSYRADLADVDYTKALSEISKQEIALQAMSTVFTKVASVTLFDYL